MKLAWLLLFVLAVGCIGAGDEVSPTPLPTSEPTPEPTVEPTPTPTPPQLPRYDSSHLGETITRGDFEVLVGSVGTYRYISPFGEEISDYRIDFEVKNTASSEREFRFGYWITDEETIHYPRWLSTLDSQGILQPGESVSGYALYDVGGSLGPFSLYVQTLSLTSNDYINVVGPNTLEKPVAGNRMYATTCADSPLGEDYLGSLLGSGACESISAARDIYIYPSWREDGVVIHRLKLKNMGEESAKILIVEEIPEKWGLTAHDISFSREPIVLDSRHVAWLASLGRNEFWITDMNYTVFFENTEIEQLPAPAVLTISI